MRKVCFPCLDDICNKWVLSNLPNLQYKLIPNWILVKINYDVYALVSHTSVMFLNSMISIDICSTIRLFHDLTSYKSIANLSEQSLTTDWSAWMCFRSPLKNLTTTFFPSGEISLRVPLGKKISLAPVL